MSNEVMTHMAIEIENLRQATGNMNRKFQFYMNLVESDNLSRSIKIALTIDCQFFRDG